MWNWQDDTLHSYTQAEGLHLPGHWPKLEDGLDD